MPESELWVLLLPSLTWLYVIGLTTVSRFEVDGLSGPLGRVAVLAFCLASLGGMSLPFVFEDSMQVELMLVLFLPFFWISPTAFRLLRGEGQGSGVRKLVMRGIEGIAVFNASLALVFGGLWFGLLALALIAPGRLVGRWFYAT